MKFYPLLASIIILNISITSANKEDEYLHHLDPRSVFSGKYSHAPYINVTLANDDGYSKVYTDQSGEGIVQVLCLSRKLVHLNIHVKSGTIFGIVPFNMSCEMMIPHSVIQNLTINDDSKTVHLVWTVSKPGSYNYVLYFMRKDRSFVRYMTTNYGSYYLQNVNIQNQYQICVATIDSGWRTSLYLCVENIYRPPVTNLKAYSTSKAIFVTWDIPNDTINVIQGYIVNVTSRSGQCRSYVINMRQHCTKLHQYCQTARHIRWSFLQPLEIKDLATNTKYSVTISSISMNGLGERQDLLVKTGRADTVSNIRATLTGSSLLIQFNGSLPQEPLNVTYLLTVSLNSINLCTLQNTIIFNEVINSTSKYLDLSYGTKCYKYRIEVTPLCRCDTQEHVDRTTSILYKPSVRHMTQSLNELRAEFLSVSLIKVSWNDPLVTDECCLHGLLVELTNVLNTSNCKTWIISRRTCLELIKRVSLKCKCKNEEFMRMENDVIQTNILLHGQFNPTSNYRIKLWTITDDVNLSFDQPISYINKSECFLDCYDSTYNGLRSGSGDGSLCLPWKDFPNITDRKRYRSNICYQATNSGKVPQCIYASNGGQTNCDVPNCSQSTKYTKCVTNTEVLSSRESVTVMWPRTMSSESIVPGYITLLHNMEHECERYQVQGCTDCIKVAFIIINFFRNKITLICSVNICFKY